MGPLIIKIIIALRDLIIILNAVGFIYLICFFNGSDGVVNDTI